MGESTLAMQSRRSSQTRRRSADRTRSADWVFIGAVLLLTTLGLVMAYSTTFFWSQVQEGSPFAIFGRQVVFAALGVLALVIFSRLDYGVLQRFAIWIMGACLALLLAVLFFGDDVFGARRTFLNGSVQPAELVKIAVIVYAAAWLASRRDQVQSVANGLIPFGVIVGVVSFLVVIQPDLSTAATIVIIATAMFFMAGASVLQIVLVTLIATGAFVALVTVLPYATDRINEFIKVWREPTEMDYHIRQSLITLGGGGLFGNGIGASYQKFGYLPTPHTDSVVSVLGEEMGLVGLLVMIALFGLFAWRGLKVANEADTPFGSFIVIGVVTWVIGQMLLNVLAILAMIPFTGVPVPFLSVGGSSLVSLLAACGIVVSISRGSRMLREDAAEESLPRVRVKGGHAFRASSTIRGRNSGARFARAHRVKSAATDAGGDTVVTGRDVRFSGRLHNPRRGRAGPVRWRGKRDGA
jgi:cell division protein FtsW